MATSTVIAIFERGVLRPLKPLDLAEHEQVGVQIIRSEERVRPVLELSGIWQGLGDPTLEEIEAVTREAHRAGLDHRLSLLDDAQT